MKKIIIVEDDKVISEELFYLLKNSNFDAIILDDFQNAKEEILKCNADLVLMDINIPYLNGELLLISQFTLYADCKKGNRPSFINAGNPTLANELYEYIIEKCRIQVSNVQTGSFGADMKISLLNDGPFTIVLDSREL